MSKKHPRELYQREPFAMATGDRVTVIRGDGGFTAVIMGDHDLFTVEELACWINVGFDLRHE